MPNSRQVENAQKLSAIAYQVENYNTGQLKDNNDETTPKNMIFLESKTDITGMTAAAYRDVETGEIYIAYTGTNPNGSIQGIVQGVQDISTDATIGLSRENVQVPAAISFYEDIKAKYRGSNLIITGHSLGGGLANTVNVWAKGEHTSITFNAAPLGHLSENAVIFIDKSNFTNYRTQEDPITALGGYNKFIDGPIDAFIEENYPGGLTNIGHGGHSDILGNTYKWSAIDPQVKLEDNKIAADEKMKGVKKS